jgi:hypothetical protein
MTHEKMMEKAWRFIHEIGITDDGEKAAADESLYLVENIYQVRDAYYEDLENGINIEGESLEEFFKRHNIRYED